MSEVITRQTIDMRPIDIRRGEQPDGSIVEVTFGWSTQFGYCYECGCPAAYEIGEFHEDSDTRLRCSVCAALAASEGETIRWLFKEDFGPI